ncbi:methyltransferase domain-containing protein [Mucilaginibacter pallidiroseus]|uniref:Methyltransferase domain-containing protein n=1 Tax=Mucilaginibacter pallidiroseus TaxID=2599295 RepID=A0A563UD39_9SPHI|nr:class I SAM-dependent methyltransferase [Mucilaginibacter pallidiroseus]TWR29275.1 methyltransferase domain-containing protein [Mucilaginibacter pallidiroseus]
MKWNAELYDDKHSFVFQYGESVLEVLDVKPGEHVLDLGCGTGYLTSEIQKQGAVVTGIDASPEMIQKARETFNNVDFFVADGTGFEFDDPFDAVFSNATLHWIKDADAAIKCVYDALKTGGRFVAEMGGKGNMKQMIAATARVLKQRGHDSAEQNNPWYFPSPAQYAAKLEAAGFRVTFMVHFDRKTLLQDGRQGVGKWLNMFGPNFFGEIAAEDMPAVLNEITDILQPYYEDNGQWYADYVRLRFIAVKE